MKKKAIVTKCIGQMMRKYSFLNGEDGEVSITYEPCIKNKERTGFDLNDL